MSPITKQSIAAARLRQDPSKLMLVDFLKLLKYRLINRKNLFFKRCIQHSQPRKKDDDDYSIVRPILSHRRPIKKDGTVVISNIMSVGRSLGHVAGSTKRPS